MASSFHGRMMNVPINPDAVTDTYAVGHRDARHACAEIALGADAIRASLQDVIQFVVIYQLDHPDRAAEVQPKLNAALAALAAATGDSQ